MKANVCYYMDREGRAKVRPARPAVVEGSSSTTTANSITAKESYLFGAATTGSVGFLFTKRSRKMDILRRGKRIDTGEWAFGALTLSGEGNSVAEIGVIGSSDVHRVDPDTVGQWTGSHDMDGDLVFAGDIVDDGDYGRHVVSAPPADQYEAVSRYEFVKVVGNIYDNPGMLARGGPDAEG